MQNYFLRAIGCLCLLHTGLLADECRHGVLGKQEKFDVAAGRSLSLSCVVQHCGDRFEVDWMWMNSTSQKMKKAVKEGVTETKVALSVNETRLTLNFWSVSQLDEGFYGCFARWDGEETNQGHWIEVNVTASVPSQRKWFHRVLVCTPAFLCLPIILVLARCLSSEVEPQPLPRTFSTEAAEYRDQPHPAPQPLPRRPIPQKPSAPPRKAAPKPQQKTEVVYADISKDALRQQGAAREPERGPATIVYSSVKFS